MYYIATHPDVDKKLYDEIEKVLGSKEIDGSNIKDLSYVLFFCYVEVSKEC